MALKKLCQTLLKKQVEHSEVLLAVVMKMAETMYQKSSKSQRLREELSTNHHRLTSCVSLSPKLEITPIQRCYDDDMCKIHEHVYRCGHTHTCAYKHAMDHPHDLTLDRETSCHWVV